MKMGPASNAKIIRKYTIVLDEYDKPEGFVRVSAVAGKNNVEQDESVSAVLFTQVMDFIESVASSINESGEKKEQEDEDRTIN